MTSHGYKPVSVWSFMKTDPKFRNIRYSSVTREYYVGFGAGAGSYFPWGFYLNTFPVNAYISRLKIGRLPTALEFKFNKRMDNMFWFYWRLYDTVILKKELKKRFGIDSKISNLLKFFKAVGFLKEQDGYLYLTKRGSFWIHLIQNYFALNYVNTIWSKALNEPFPKIIKF